MVRTRERKVDTICYRTDNQRKLVLEAIAFDAGINLSDLHRKIIESHIDEETAQRGEKELADLVQKGIPLKRDPETDKYNRYRDFATLLINETERYGVYRGFATLLINKVDMQPQSVGQEQATAHASITDSPTLVPSEQVL